MRLFTKVCSDRQDKKVRRWEGLAVMGREDSEHPASLCCFKLEKRGYLLQQMMGIAMLQMIHGVLPYILPVDVI